MVFDAVRIRLLEIGEAVKALPAELLASEPDIPWAQIARMRDHLAHRYFDTTHAAKPPSTTTYQTSNKLSHGCFAVCPTSHPTHPDLSGESENLGGG